MIKTSTNVASCQPTHKHYTLSNKFHRFHRISSNVNFSFIRSMFAEGWFFILASFLSAITPLGISLIVSGIPNDGSHILVSIGLLASVQAVFLNIGIVIGLNMIGRIFNKMRKYHSNWLLVNEDGIISAQIIVNIIISALMTIMYLIVGILFVNYSFNYDNLVMLKGEGFSYVYTSSPAIFLNAWFSFFTVVIFKKSGNGRASLVIFIHYLMQFIFVSIFAYGSDLNGLGIGLGQLIGVIISICIFVGIYLYKTHTYSVFYGRTSKKEFKKLFMNSLKSSLETSWRVGTRGIILVILSVLSNHPGEIMPLNMIFAKTVWFITFVILPFFGVGIINAIKYQFVENDHKYNRADIKPLMILLGFTLIVIAIIMVIWFSALPALISQYIKNFQTLKTYALEHLYNPMGDNIDAFKYAYDTWGHMPIPEFINDPYYANNPHLIQYMNQNGTNGLGQLYWVNLTVHGHYSDGQASIMNLFWGWDAWKGMPDKYPPVFNVTALLLFVYNIGFITEISLSLFNIMYTKKPKPFYISIMLHTSVMVFVLIFGYFYASRLGIMSYAIPFTIYTYILLAYTGTRFYLTYRKLTR